LLTEGTKTRTDLHFYEPNLCRHPSSPKSLQFLLYTKPLQSQHLYQSGTQYHNKLTVKKQLLSAAHTNVFQLHKFGITEGLWELLGAFVKLRKSTVSFVMSVPLSPLNKSFPKGRIFIKFGICVFLTPGKKNSSLIIIGLFKVSFR